MQPISWRLCSFPAQVSAIIATASMTEQPTRERTALTHPIHKMSIQQLPEEVIAQIKSSTTITSLNGVILELMKNSLDAGSTKIDVTVDYSRGGCLVEDNGSGILPSEFGSTGGLGKLYREYLEHGYEAKVTQHRFLQTEFSNSGSRWSWDVSCTSGCYFPAHYHIPSPSAPLP